jgi:peptidoglycan hydrolase-like protein with peptidoglycan-binding domain
MAAFRLDNRPVTLLYGPLPAYRALTTGVRGADVRQFERNLWALGYRGFTADSSYSRATASAVRKWQGDIGVVTSGSVDPRQIVYAAGAVRVESLSAQVGAVVGPGTAVHRVTGTAPLATVALDMSSARLADRDDPVRVTLPDGKVVPGTISETTTVVNDSGETATTRIQVTIRFDAAISHRGAGAVTVAFPSGERPDVLAVPVVALLALPEGGYGVQVVEQGATRIVAVQPGLFADGKVEVTGTGLRAGMTVAVPS